MSRVRTEPSAHDTGNIGPMNTAPSTRSGCSAASSIARCAPRESATITAASVPVSSMTARASAANSASAYAPRPFGRSERPLPRGSNVTARKCRAKYGTCAFHTRECTRVHVGRKSTVGSPSPWTS